MYSGSDWIYASESPLEGLERGKTSSLESGPESRAFSSTRRTPPYTASRLMRGDVTNVTVAD